MNQQFNLTQVALELAQSTLHEHSFDQLLATVERVIPSDASALLVVQGEQLIGTAVAARVHADLAAVHELRPTPGQGVVQATDSRLVAGDRMRREDHRVAVTDGHAAVSTLRHEGQGGTGLTL